MTGKQMIMTSVKMLTVGDAISNGMVTGDIADVQNIVIQ